MENLVPLCAIAAEGYINLLSLQLEHSRTIRRWWVRPVLQRRKSLGHENVLQEMENKDPEWFFCYIRMDYDQFEWILTKISPVLEKQRVAREPITPKLRLFLTLRHLALGDNYFSLASIFLIGISTVCEIIREVCRVLWDELHKYAFKPLTETTWKEASDGFNEYWNIPHACGAIDGKHVKIKAPNQSGTLFYNYKGTYSVVLLAIADPHYRFLYVNIGAYGSNSDGGILGNSRLGELLTSGEMNLPKAEPLVAGEESVPYFLLGDEAFGLKCYCMVPYAGRYLPEEQQNFNKRLSRGRRVIENSFGIMSSRWQIYHRTIASSPETAELIIKSTVVLHNLLCTSSMDTYAPPSYVDWEENGIIIPGDWRNNQTSSWLVDLPEDLQGSEPPNVPTSAVHTRDYLNEFLNQRRIGTQMN